MIPDKMVEMYANEHALYKLLTDSNNPVWDRFLNNEEMLKLAKYLVGRGVGVVQHGQWIYKNTCGPHTAKFHCSVCGEIPKSLCMEDYCPNCGAPMDLEE